MAAGAGSRQHQVGEPEAAKKTDLLPPGSARSRLQAEVLRRCNALQDFVELLALQPVGGRAGFAPQLIQHMNRLRHGANAGCGAHIDGLGGRDPHVLKIRQAPRKKTLQENGWAAFTVHKPVMIPGGGES